MWEGWRREASPYPDLVDLGKLTEQCQAEVGQVDEIAVFVDKVDSLSGANREDLYETVLSSYNGKADWFFRGCLTPIQSESNDITSPPLPSHL